MGIYDQKYLDHYKALGETELGKRIGAYRWGFLRRHLNGYKTLLDYGAGAGSFLDSPAAIPGIKTSGFDINPYSRFFQDKFAENGNEILTAFDVLEHLESPRALLEKSRAKLLVLLTPNVEAVPKSMITTWRHYKPGEHLHHYGPESLRALFKSTGYHMEGWDFLEGAHRNPTRPTDLITVAASRK